ncbi:MAG: heme ABC transporter ATP-binding protein [Desulfobulbaceae bacterium]|uniref:Heme ABC transporter ATP-binding protein n=1 Tax=Candidatus Desulfobia pelagia TaxID=2841692 RepID=A0A8J6NC72_9BACT|nr:heme ABC transporter ATP-binding protein [Candidatus Desulfobia pelagia]
MSAVTVRDLSLSFRHTPVLRNISLEVQPGAFFMIIGPNGAGKTTLLKVLANLIASDKGNIEILGKPLSSYSKRQLAQVTAMVPQQVTTDFPFTVAETVLMGRSPHIGLLAIEGKEDVDIANQAMEFTDVAHLADRKLDQVSGGERQRVIIARAICQQTKIILLDEPTAALDPSHQLKIMDLMERLRREQQITVIMVSHDLNLAGMYGQQLLLLKNGKIEKTGTPQEVLTQEQLTSSYNCSLFVDENPITQKPRVNLVPEK